MDDFHDTSVAAAVIVIYTINTFIYTRFLHAMVFSLLIYRIMPACHTSHLQEHCFSKLIGNSSLKSANEVSYTCKDFSSKQFSIYAFLSW